MPEITENEYLDVSNLVAVRNARNILNPCLFTQEDIDLSVKIVVALNLLYEIEQKLQSKIKIK
jgi:hypothetical protein